MAVDVVVESDLWDAAQVAGGFDEFVLRMTDATLSARGLDPDTYEVVVLACDDARIAELNGTFRAKQAATNVLSWPSEERGAATKGGQPQSPQDTELGDIAISYQTCAREAAEQNKTFETHVAHLLVHGTLHLLGFDHISDEDAALMEGLERDILAQLGFPDPYEGMGGAI